MAGLTAPRAHREVAQEGEIPDDIEDFMADKFIGIRSGSVVRIASSRITTAFSKAPP
jgi:hypothetical protein